MSSYTISNFKKLKRHIENEHTSENTMLNLAQGICMLIAQPKGTRMLGLYINFI